MSGAAAAVGVVVGEESVPLVATIQMIITKATKATRHPPPSEIPERLAGLLTPHLGHVFADLATFWPHSLQFFMAMFSTLRMGKEP